ncbi:MAG: hypothetical protein AAF799_15290 [Myxococcota bacterium]
MTKTRTSAFATTYRSIGAVIIGAMSLNCTASPDGFEPTIDGLEESEAEEIDENLIAVIDAPDDDPERSYYELRSLEIDGAFELRGYSDEGYVSRLKMQQFYDLELEPWVQIELDDEDLSMAGHFRFVRDEDGRPTLELDADVNGRIVAIRMDPSAPEDAEIFGFPGAPEGVFSSLMAYDDTTGFAQRFMTSWQRMGAIGPDLKRELSGADDFKFRSGVTCIGCVFDALSASVLSGACVAAAAAAGATCAAPPTAVACPAAVAVAAGACGVALQEISNFLNTCVGACADDGPIHDPCAGGCSCPGGRE